MKKSDGKIDWKMEDDNSWHTNHSSALAEAPTAPNIQSIHRKEVALATFIALLPLLLSVWLWQRPTSAKQLVTHPSTAILQTIAPQGQPLTHSIEMLDKGVQVDKIQRLGDRIMAELTVNYAEEGKVRPYRETRFYQKKGEQWQRIPPDPMLLGPAKTLQIAHFSILYRAVDAGAVYEAAPKLQQLYANVRHDFGLPIAAAGSTYTIEVATSGVQSVYRYDLTHRKITVSSPTLLSAPIEIAPAILLYQAVVYPFARLAQNESINRHDARWQNNFAHWQPIESALPLWELWQDGGPLASGRATVVPWLYANGKNAATTQPLSNEYDSLCRTYRIWQTMPLDSSIPLTCTGADTRTRAAGQYPALASTWRQQTQFAGKGQSQQASAISSVVTTETIIEYIVVTYGRDKVPQLLEAMGAYTTIETLIPALFGISQANFEAGWQTYLAQHY